MTKYIEENTGKTFYNINFMNISEDFNSTGNKAKIME